MSLGAYLWACTSANYFAVIFPKAGSFCYGYNNIIAILILSSLTRARWLGSKSYHTLVQESCHMSYSLWPDFFFFFDGLVLAPALNKDNRMEWHTKNMCNVNQFARKSLRSSDRYRAIAIPWKCIVASFHRRCLAVNFPRLLSVREMCSLSNRCATRTYTNQLYLKRNVWVIRSESAIPRIESKYRKM